MSIETPWANDVAGGTKLNATRLLSYTPIRGSFTNPNGNVVGSPGNTYLNTTGGAGQTLWVKETGVGTNTGWTAAGSGSGGVGPAGPAGPTGPQGPQGPAGTAGSGAAITTQDEGTTLTANTTAYNFTGTGVTASNSGGSVTVAIPGGGSGAVSSVAGRTGAVVLTSADVGLGNVTNNAAVPLSTVTAKGDVIGGTGSGFVGRLGVGTDGQVLTAASGQFTGMQWAAPPGGASAWTTSFTVDTGNPSRNFIVLNATAGQYMRTLNINHYWALMDGTANEFFQVYLLLIQDSVGGWICTFPSAIAWSGVSVGSTGQPTLVTTPNTLTLIKFTWLGINNGYLAEV